MEQKWKISKAQERQRNARTKEEASVSTHALVAHTRRRVCFYVFLLVLLILSLKDRIIILFPLLSLSLTRTCFLRRGRAFRLATIRVFYVLAFHSLSLFLSLPFSLSLTLTHLFTSSINYLLYRLAYISLIRKMFIPRLRSCLRLPCTTVASARCFLRWFPSSLCRSLPKSSQPSF